VWNQNYACFLVTYLEVTVPITWSKQYSETLTLENNQHLAHFTINNLDSFLKKKTLQIVARKECIRYIKQCSYRGDDF